MQMQFNRRDFLSSTIGASFLATQLQLEALADDIDEFCDSVSFHGSLLRHFELPLPLFSATSAWRQKADVAAVKANNEKYVATVYNILSCAKVNFCWVNLHDFTIPVFAAHASARTDFSIHAYHCEVWKPSTLPSVKQFGRFIVSNVPKPAGWVRPSGPATNTDQEKKIDGRDADGHLVLYHSSSKQEYDFWQATTCHDYDGISRGGGLVNDTILESGAIEVFDVKGPGAQKLAADCRPRGSARASGIPLLAGLLVPEDLKDGIDSTISHAFVFAMPRLRHICPAGAETPPDFVYPATKTETSSYLDDPFALGAGERIRLRKADATSPLLDIEGKPICEELLAPITRIFLQTLREYGAYLVDGAKAFTFYAEDVNTANLSLDHVNELIGAPAGTLVPNSRTNWQVVIEKLQDEISRLPFAVKKGPDLHANFEIIENASVPAGLESGHCSVKQINQCE